MNKKISFVLALLIGIVVISISFYRFWDLDKIAEYVAIYVAGSTALYTILAEPNSIKTEKQQIYGQLYRAIEEFILVKERREYQRVSFGFWNDAKNQRYFIDEKFRNRLDTFMQKVQKYDDVVCELDYVILPKIIKETVKMIFKEEPDSMSNFQFQLNYTVARKQHSLSFSLVDHLRIGHTLADLKKRWQNTERDKTNLSFVGWQIRFIKEDSQPFSSTKSEDISKFYETCLQIIIDTTEHQFVTKENEMLLEEAKNIKKELIKRIEGTIEA